MKISRIIAEVVFCACLVPALASAQSFWLHKQLSGPAGLGIAAELASLNDSCFFLIHGGNPDFEQVSSDYGQTWKYVIVDTPKNYLRKYGLTCFVHPTPNLIVVGCNDHNVGHLIRSTDAGATWQDTGIGSYMKGQPGNFITGMAALDSTHIAMLVGDTITYLSNHLMLSTDAGTTWRSLSTPNFVYAAPASADPTNPVLYYLNGTTVLVAAIGVGTDNSTVYRTTDLGNSWDIMYRPNSTITKFAFINPLCGFASGVYFDLNAKTETATIDKTTDGGATWQNIFTKTIIPFSTSFFKNTAGLYSIAFADSLHGLACGAQGLILRTTDGGISWDEIRSDFTIDVQSVDLLYDVAYPDTDHAMIGASDGSVLIYHPDGILGLPNITYPIFSPPTAPRTFDITWDAVPNATRYAITITTGGNPDSATTIYLRDTNIVANYYHVSNLVDTAPPPENNGRQYELYLQAFNATNVSNVAKRIFIVYQVSNGVETDPPPSEPSPVLYPDPATNWLNVTGFSGPVTIIDALGRTYDFPLQDGKIDISKLPAGIYYLSTKSLANGDLHRTKFVKR